MFGSGKSRRDWKYIRWGLKQRTNEQARREYEAEADAAIRELGLVVPHVGASLRYATV